MTNSESTKTIVEGEYFTTRHHSGTMFVEKRIQLVRIRNIFTYTGLQAQTCIVILQIRAEELIESLENKKMETLPSLLFLRLVKIQFFLVFVSPFDPTQKLNIC